MDALLLSLLISTIIIFVEIEQYCYKASFNNTQRSIFNFVPKATKEVKRYQ